MGTLTPYKPLPEAGKIRILHLEPGVDEICFHLQVVDLGPSTQYEAISYCWGDPTDTRTVSCGGQPINVTNSLYTALKRLRLPYARRSLWADAVCINQNDLSEKSEQVKLMGQIYTHATRILIWLGDDTTGIDGLNDCIRGALELLPPETHDAGVLRDTSQSMFLESSALRKDGKPNFKDHNWDPINNILCRPWFERKWIIQEVVMADDRVPRLALCGETEFPWRDLASVAFRMGAYGVVNSLAGLSAVNAFTPYMSSFYLNEGMPLRTVTNAFMILLIAHYRPTANLVDAVIATASFKCTDPKDHIYALLGVPARNSGFEPDYSLSTEEVFRRFATTTLVKDQNLKILSLAPHTSFALENKPPVQRLPLPSWIPDLTATGLVNPLVSYTIRPPLFSSGGLTKDAVTISNNGLHLNLRGRIIDTIETTVTSFADIPFPSPADIHPKQDFASMVKMRIRNWIRECADMALEPGWRDRVPDAQWLAFARTILCDMTGMRDPLPETVLAMVKVYVDYVFDFFKSDFVLTDHMHAALLTYGTLIEQSLTSMAETRRFCKTTGGRLGQVRKEAKAGDLICVVLGAEVPYTLRATGTGTYALIGESFVLGSMYGEALSDERYTTVDIMLE